MKTRFLDIWFRLTSSYWFIPTVMLVASFLLSHLFIWVDGLIGKEDLPKVLHWIYLNKTEGARSLLSTIAGSMITVAGVVFSITIVALTLASTQFGPRILTNFVRDKGNQFVLGAFISTFVYCLSLLRTIRGGEDNLFIPHISIIVGFALAIFNIFVLIYFIHHISKSIQVSNIISNINSELLSAIERRFPKKLGIGTSDVKKAWVSLEDPPKDFEERSVGVPASRSGYVRILDDNRLISFAKSNDIIIKLECRPGDYLIEGIPLAYVYPKENYKESIDSRINGDIVIGPQRTSEQDVEFPINQIVEIALRALSPGINDPFTALGCIERLTASLCELAKGKAPSPFRYDVENKLRIIAKPEKFSELIDKAFNQILHYGRSNFVVVTKLIESVNKISHFLHNDEDIIATMNFVELVRAQSKPSQMVDVERDEINRLCENALDNLQDIKLKHHHV